VIFPTTPSQTVGPFLSIGLPWPTGEHVVPEGTCGSFRLGGSIYDGAGALVPDALVETWQADPDGRFADLWGYGGPSELEGFRGFGRSGYEEGDGTWSILTVKPGPVPWLDGSMQAPHLDVSVFARGMLHRVVTRIYFADEEALNAEDPVLRSVPADRRETLLARPSGDGYVFDLRLQGPDETVFFAT
jgi:protocatechuate 3,4-dioxygenase alpha subunit